MALYGEFRYGDGVLYGALSPAIRFTADVLVQEGGARHGAVEIEWDISSPVDNGNAFGVMIVAREMQPASVPEDGETILQSFDVRATPSGRATYYSQAGTWTYLSLFLLGSDYRWRWSSFRLVLPVSDWEYGTRVLPSMVPGVMKTDDYVVASPHTEGNLLTELLGEFGFLLDEVKSSAEALVPTWDSRNVVPQAAPQVAALLGLPFIAELGPEPYRRLLAIGSEDSSLDILSLKSAVVTGYRTRVRPSTNYLLNVNDSSAESRVGNESVAIVGASGNGSSVTFTTDGYHGLQVGSSVAVSGVSPSGLNMTATVTAVPSASSFTVASTVTATYTSGGSVVKYRAGWIKDGTTYTYPTRIAYANDEPADADDFDLSTNAYMRFPSGGTWVLRDPSNDDRHLIDVSSWPTVIGGFYARKVSGTSPTVKLSVQTRANYTDTTWTTVDILTSSALTTDWQWFASDVLGLNTDEIARAVLTISPSDAVVEIDNVLLGFAPTRYRYVPTLVANVQQNHSYNQSDFTYNQNTSYDRLTVGLYAQNAPEFGTALVYWGDDSYPQTINWSSLGGSVTTHDYTSSVVQDEEVTMYIVAKDTSDLITAGSTTVVIGKELI